MNDNIIPSLKVVVPKIRSLEKKISMNLRIEMISVRSCEGKNIIFNETIKNLQKIILMIIFFFHRIYFYYHFLPIF